MNKRTVLIALRLVLSILTLTAIAIQFAIHVQLGFSILNFFSYFTNLSNLCAAIVFIYGAFRLVTHRKQSASDDLIRGAVAVNMAVVGIVFTILLRNVDLGALLPWVNTLLHYIMPVAVVTDWFYQPPGMKLGVRQMLLWQVFPLIYLAFVLIRGSTVGWYPYPFLNPATMDGNGVVAAYIIGIMIVFLVVSWLSLTLGNKLNENVAKSSE